MNSIETVAKNIRLEVMQYAFFHLFPVAVAGTAMIMDIRTAKVDNGWIIFSMSVGLFVCIWQKNITGIGFFIMGSVMPLFLMILFAFGMIGAGDIKLVYIKTDTGLTSVSYTTELSVLDNLLDEIGRELEIGNICNLFLSSDCRAYDNALPEAYSDAEIRKFNCALTKLKPQLGRCLIIHQMLGTRIEDTLTLRRDCLSEKSGHYFITIIQQKTRKYKRPVSDQLAELIRKAIEVSEKEHPDSEYIFLQDNGKLYTDSMLKYHVNIMIYENDIRDDNGNYFEFRTHRYMYSYITIIYITYIRMENID